VGALGLGVGAVAVCAAAALLLAGRRAAAAVVALAAAFATSRPCLFEDAYLWVGGSGATTGLHSDDENNILLMTRGRKVVRLHAPSDRRFLSPNGRYDSGTECCDVDAFLGEAAKAGKYAGYAGCPAPLRFELGPGDALYIPAFWFHAVRSEALSVSVNVFFSTPLEMARRWPQRAFFAVCHEYLGFWRGDCVCHRPPSPPGPAL